MKPVLKDLSDLINNFVSSLDYRSDLFVVYNETTVKKIMEWQLATWRNWVNRIGESDAGNYWFSLHQMTNQAFTKIGKRSVKANDYAFSISFLQNYSQFMEHHKNETVKTNTKTWEYPFYSYNLFFDLVTEFVSTAQGNNRELFWQNFSNEWKITANNLLNQKPFAKLAFDQFLHWAQSRVQAQKQEDDNTFHYIVEGLFPELDSRTWEIILLFVFTPYNPEARVRSVVERYWSIGHISVETLTFAYTVKPGEDESEIVAQKHKEIDEKIRIVSQRAYELAILLFSNIFDKDNLAKYVTEAESLEYSEEADREDNRVELLKVLAGLRETINSNEGQTDKGKN